VDASFTPFERLLATARHLLISAALNSQHSACLLLWKDIMMLVNDLTR
jgi:hypothetical protein